MERNIRLLIAYDGTAYRGWQRQKNGSTIQGVLEDKLSILCNHPIQLHGAGRTDAGVHALGMVAHFSTSVSHRLTAFSTGLNSMLPKDIRILDSRESAPDFHARFSALAKTYRYDFYTGTIMPPTRRLYEAHYPGNFTHRLVNQCLPNLIGCHDFASFEGAGSRDPQKKDGRGSRRTLYRAVCREKNGPSQHWSLYITGDGFLRHMVRNLVGTLLAVGQEKISPSDFSRIFMACDRRTAGKTAPACGLFLEHIYYDNQEIFNRKQDEATTF